MIEGVFLNEGLLEALASQARCAPRHSHGAEAIKSSAASHLESANALGSRAQGCSGLEARPETGSEYP